MVTPDEGRRAVLENLRAGADLIKVVADDPPRAIHDDTMKAIVDEAHSARLRVAVHATTRPGIEAAIAAGADSIEHGDEASDQQFQAMRQKRIVFVPTVWPRGILPVPRSLAALPNIDALVDGYVAGERAKVDRARKAGKFDPKEQDKDFDRIAEWLAYLGKTPRAERKNDKLIEDGLPRLHPLFHFGRRKRRRAKRTPFTAPSFS